MKIILTFNELRRDGMGTAALTLYRALRSQGVEVCPIHAWDEINFPEYEQEARPRIVRAGPRHDPITDDVQILTKALNDLCEDGDVVIDSGSPNWLCTIPYLKPGIRWITCVHSINPSTLKLCRAYPDRVSAWVCISKGVRDRFLKKLPKQYHDRVHLICNAVTDCEKPKVDYSAGDMLKIVYVGRIEDSSKGCGKIPLILSELRRRGIKARCDFYGYFHDWEKQFWTVVDKVNVRDMVKYCGEIKHEDVYAFLPQYDVFLSPSNFEGFGLSLAEAMACAVPTVASLIPGVTDWLADYGNSGLVVPKMDIRGFADALESLFKNQNLRVSLGERGHRRIIELAGFEAHGQSYADIARMVSADDGYKMIKPHCSIEHYTVPGFLKPWGPARLLPGWLKSWLRRFM